MQFSDKKGCKRGSSALLCFKETPDTVQSAWGGIRVGVHGAELDFKVRPRMGVVDIGYREELRGNEEDGVARVEFRLERKIYLHSDRDCTLITGKVDPRAPVMSVAFQVGAAEIHTPVIENQDFCDEIIAAGVNVVLMSSNGGAEKPAEEVIEEPEQPVVDETPPEPPTPLKKKGGRPKGSKNKADKKAKRSK